MDKLIKNNKIKNTYFLKKSNKINLLEKGFQKQEKEIEIVKNKHQLSQVEIINFYLIKNLL